MHATPPAPGPSAPDEQVQGLLTGVALLRLVVLVWAAVVVVIDLSGTTRVEAVPAVLALVALAAWTSFIAWCTRQRPLLLVAGPLVPFDVLVAAAVAGADHLVYDGPHPQTFASAWPLGAVVTAGILRGPLPGALAGVVVGLGGAVGTAVFLDGGLHGRWMATAGSLVLLTIGGVLAGVVTDALRRAESTAARARAREEFARELHDGVLQTLAVVQRRSDDRDLVGLAREQELELRRYIGDTTSGPDAAPAVGRSEPVGVVAALRRATAAAEHRTGVRCELVVVDEPDWLTSEHVDALCGAVGEAVTNADKHGRARRAVVCVECEDDGAALVTVTDDGTGFDPATTEEGVGLSRSVRGRLADVDGAVEIDSRPGRGTEVRLRIPRAAGRTPRRF